MGNERLHRAGKAAAVYAPSAVFCEKLACDRTSEGDALFVRCFGRIIVLKEVCAGVAGFLDDREELCDIAACERFEHTFHSAVFADEVECTEDRSVAAFLAERCGFLDDIRFGETAEHGLIEMLRNGFHFRGNSGVIVGEICVRAACVDDAECVAFCGKVKCNAFCDGLLGVFEVDRNEATCRASDLVHQTAGLAEVYVFCVLGNLGNFDVIYLAIVVEVVEDGADHIFECGRGGKTGAAENVGGGISDEAADREVVLYEAVANTADEGCGTTGVLEYGGELIYGNNVFGEACALDADGVVVGLLDDGDDIEVDGGCEDLAVVVVGVVTADLASAGNGEYGKVVRFAVDGFKFIESGVVARFHGFCASVGVDLVHHVFCVFEKCISVEHMNLLVFVFWENRYSKKVFPKRIRFCSFWVRILCFWARLALCVRWRACRAWASAFYSVRRICPWVHRVRSFGARRA